MQYHYQRFAFFIASACLTLNPDWASAGLSSGGNVNSTTYYSYQTLSVGSSVTQYPFTFQTGNSGIQYDAVLPSNTLNLSAQSSYDTGVVNWNYVGLESGEATASAAYGNLQATATAMGGPSRDTLSVAGAAWQDGWTINTSSGGAGYLTISYTVSGQNNITGNINHGYSSWLFELNNVTPSTYTIHQSYSNGSIPYPPGIYYEGSTSIYEVNTNANSVATPSGTFILPFTFNTDNGINSALFVYANGGQAQGDGTTATASYSGSIQITGVYDSNGNRIGNFSMTTDSGTNYLSSTAVPLPAGVWLFASGLLGWGVVGKRRR